MSKYKRIYITFKDILLNLKSYQDGPHSDMVILLEYISWHTLGALVPNLFILSLCM